MGTNSEARKRKQAESALTRRSASLYWKAPSWR